MKNITEGKQPTQEGKGGEVPEKDVITDYPEQSSNHTHGSNYRESIIIIIIIIVIIIVIIIIIIIIIVIIIIIIIIIVIISSSSSVRSFC